MNTKTYKLKRLLDLSMVTCGFLFPLLWPLWIVVIFIIPLLIWLEDRGPIFYSQNRIGKNKKVFKVYKFRTMIPDAEKISGAISVFTETVNESSLEDFNYFLNIYKK